jgi:hypothetical protein
MPRLPVLVLSTLLLSSFALAEDSAIEKLDNWPHWRGPLANGTAPKADPPVHWDDKTNIKWKAALPGRGSATPIVWGNRVFIATAVDTGKQAKPEDVPAADPKFPVKTSPPMTYYQWLVLCFDRRSGKELWRRKPSRMRGIMRHIRTQPIRP